MLRRFGLLMAVSVAGLSGVAARRAPTLVPVSFRPGQIFDKLRNPVPPPADAPPGTPPQQYVIPWRALESYISQIAFAESFGEKNHLLQPVMGQEVRASIFPTANVWLERAERLAKGYVVAKIVADNDYLRLGIHRGDNYLVVWRSARKTTGMVDSLGIISASGRMRLPFDFQIHPGATAVNQSGTTGNSGFRDAAGAVGGGALIPATGGTGSVQSPALSPATLDCVGKAWKACFIDSKDHQVETIPPPSGPMLELRETVRPGGGSEPWISCMLFGCCCGGTQCHT